MQLCESPYVPHVGDHWFPCNHCSICLRRRRNLWSLRLILESMDHADSSFITMTYDQEHVPPNGSLVPLHYVLWLKRIRAYFSPQKLRYFICGEYGDVTFRPHLHCALFGVPAHQVVDAEVGRDSSITGFNDGWRVDSPRLWENGSSSITELSTERCGYLAGYVTKKMTQSDDPRLQGRKPEFARMSLRPGLGAKTITRLVPFLRSDEGRQLKDRLGDVPGILRQDGRVKSIGRYLKGKVREVLAGCPDTPEKALYSYGEELRKLLEEARANPKNAHKKKKDLILDMTAGRVASLKKKFSISQSRRYL